MGKIILIMLVAAVMVIISIAGGEVDHFKKGYIYKGNRKCLSLYKSTTYEGMEKRSFAENVYLFINQQLRRE